MSSRRPPAHRQAPARLLVGLADGVLALVSPLVEVIMTVGIVAEGIVVLFRPGSP